MRGKKSWAIGVLGKTGRGRHLDTELFAKKRKNRSPKRGNGGQEGSPANGVRGGGAGRVHRNSLPKFGEHIQDSSKTSDTVNARSGDRRTRKVVDYHGQGEELGRIPKRTATRVARQVFS